MEDAKSQVSPPDRIFLTPEQQQYRIDRYNLYLAGLPNLRKVREERYQLWKRMMVDQYIKPKVIHFLD